MLESASARSLHLPPDQVSTVRNILRQIIPGRQVWAFGSRATGRQVKRFSDLDLAIEGELSWDERATLVEAFDESWLPIKVDLLELAQVSAEFRARIEPDLLPLQVPAAML